MSKAKSGSFAGGSPEKCPAKSLDTGTIRRVVSKNAIGAYRLFKSVNGIIELAYWGRSDTSLRRRLQEHSRNGKYTHFVIETAESVYEAFRRECRDYHLRIPGIDNRMHPAPPKGSSYSCPYCSVTPGSRIFITRVVS